MKDDTISRAAAIDAIEFGITYARAINKETGEVKELFQDANDELRKAVERVKKLPSAQPDIIACGDCKHWICHDRRCGFWNHGVKPLDWCCHAERGTE